MKKLCLALLPVTMACAVLFARQQPVGKTYNIGDTGQAHTFGIQSSWEQPMNDMSLHF